MKKFMSASIMIMMLFVLTGCNDDSTDSIDLTDPEVIENCDKNADGEVTRIELEECNWVPVGGTSKGKDNESSDQKDDVDTNAASRNENTEGLEIVDVRAITNEMTVTFDSAAGVAEIDADGETFYQDTNGYMYANIDGGWVSMKMIKEGGLITQDYPELADASYINPDAPSAIPIADMPYKALYKNLIQKYTPTATTCASGVDCEEIVTDEGGILRYDNTLRLVEAVLEGQLVSFEHGDFTVSKPNAQIIDVPQVPGMPAGFDMSQFQ